MERFKCLQEHCSDLALIIAQLGYDEVYNWLMIASGIEIINFRWNRFDKTGGTMWCRPSYEYDVAKGNINQQYIQQLTIFNYIWGGLENLLSKEYSKSRIKKEGKINICVLELGNLVDLEIINYEYFQKEFFKYLEITIESSLLEYKRKLPSEELKIIYQIRNKFAHGDLKFPEDEDDNFGLSNPMNLIKLISVSSRVVLCNIQSLILDINRNELVYSYLDNLFQNIEIEDYGDDLFPTELILSHLHLKELPLKILNSH